MSHYTCYVLMPRVAPSKVEAQLHERLAPFDENKNVEPYDEPCYCVGAKAKIAGRAAAEMTSPIERLRTEFAAAHGSQMKRRNAIERGGEKEAEEGEFDRLDAELERLWALHIAESARVEKETTEAHAEHKKPDAECDECHGSGTERSTYNPKSKWNWWVVGGRWAGSIRDAAEKMPEEPNMISDPAGYERARAERNSVEGNSRPVAEFPSPIPDKLIPFAILTPEGEWCERGKMGMFEFVASKNANWKDQAREVFQRYRSTDTIAVAVDLHI